MSKGPHISPCEEARTMLRQKKDTSQSELTEEEFLEN